jgi:hypothetical protein
MRRAIVFLVVVIFSACSSGPVRKDILRPDRMQKVMYDLIRADEFINNFVRKDSTADLMQKRSVLYEEAFKANNTTRKEFYSSYTYYQQHPDVQKILFDSLYSTINRSQAERVPGKQIKPVP